MQKINPQNMAPWKKRDGHDNPTPPKVPGHRLTVLHRRTPKPHKKPVVTVGAVLLAVLFWPSTAWAGVNDVPKKVRQGIEHYEAGRFDQAARAFGEAQKKQPDDARLMFDVACAKAAAGAVDEAVPLLQQAAVTPDAKLAARCHYNLGRLAADRAKAALGKKPGTAPADARARARELIAAAAAHWRDCLAMRPNHADARYNIELASLWLDHMDHLWKAADRQKRLEKMKLARMLQWLETEQAVLRGATRALDGREPSPLYRLAVHQTAGSQRELGEQIDPLKQKIAQEINQPQPSQGCPSGTCPTGPGMANPPAAPATCGVPGGGGLARMDPNRREHAIKLLSGLADRAGESMRTAAEHLAEQSPADASVGQAEVIENLDQITTVITPYPELVHKAVARQKELVGQVKSLAEPSTSPAEAAPAEDKPAATEPARPDLPETAWRQRFVERWTPIIVAKAKQGLQNMPPPEPEPPAAAKPANRTATVRERQAAKEKGATAGSSSSADDTIQPITRADQPPMAPSSEDTKGAPEKPDPQEAARKQRENLRKSMELAVKLGPDVQRLVARAAGELDADRAADALAKQEEALKLLEKIAEPLRQPNKNQQNQQNQNQNQDQKDKDNQDKKDQKNKDENKDKQDKNQGKDEKKDQKKQDRKDGNQQKQPKPKDQPSKAEPQKRQPRDLSKQQARALMQQVRQRGREKEKARKALMEMISRPPKAEKDW